MRVDLDRSAVTALLVELGHRLAAKGLRAELFVVGGSAMALAYDERRSATDVDAVFRPREEVLAEASAMAAANGLEPHWLSDGVRAFWRPVEDEDPRTLLDLPGVRITYASPDYVLAMKCMSGRKSAGDLEDAALLAEMLGIRSEAELEAVVQRYFGPAQLGSIELWLERITERTSARRQPDQAGDGTSSSVRPGAVRPFARCTHWLVRAGRACSLAAGHRGQHR